MTKTKKWVWIVGGIVIVILLAVFFFSRNGKGLGETALAARKNVVQKVSVSGKVESSQKAELSFETAGTVRQIVRQEGEQVKTGALIASLDTAELAVRLEQQQAALAKSQLALQTLIDPPKVVDRTAAENEVALKQEALKQAKDDASNILASAFVDFPTILNDLNDLVVSGSDYLSDNSVRFQGARALNYRDEARAAYWAAKKAYDDAKKVYEQSGRTSSGDSLQGLTTKTYQVARLVSDALKKSYTLVAYLENQVSVVPDQLSADKTTLDTHTATVNTHLLDLVSANDSISQAARDLTEAQQQLEDLLNGADANDVSTARLAVRQAELDVEDTRVQLAKRQIRAPFDGVVARNDLELGETVNASQALVSMITDGQYEAVARVSEAEISKIKVGDMAQITLDAYSPEDLKLAARISAVNLAEVVVDGVATYKVTLQFVNPSDKIRSGMTTNIEITGATRENVIAIPERALQIKDGGYLVRVVNGKTTEDRAVTIGLRGSDGQVEILSGLNEGETVSVGAAQ